MLVHTCALHIRRDDRVTYGVVLTKIDQDHMFIVVSNALIQSDLTRFDGISLVLKDQVRSKMIEFYIAD